MRSGGDRERCREEKERGGRSGRHGKLGIDVKI